MVAGFGCTIIKVVLWAVPTSVSVDTNVLAAKESYHPWDTTRYWLGQRHHQQNIQIPHTIQRQHFNLMDYSVNCLHWLKKQSIVAACFAWLNKDTLKSQVSTNDSPPVLSPDLTGDITGDLVASSLTEFSSVQFSVEQLWYFERSEVSRQNVDILTGSCLSSMRTVGCVVLSCVIVMLWAGWWWKKTNWYVMTPEDQTWISGGSQEERSTISIYRSAPISAWASSVGMSISALPAWWRL